MHFLSSQVKKSMFVGDVEYFYVNEGSGKREKMRLEKSSQNFRE